MKPIGSAITGMPRLAPQAGSPTGAQRGETGSALTLSADPASAMHPAVTARLPTANTEAALSRMQQFGVACSVKMETVFPTTADGDTTFRQRPTSLTVNSDSSADWLGALRVIQEAMKPASEDQIEGWLAELSAKTARRKSSEMDADLALRVYTGHLRAYPADTVRHVLTGYRGTWFPTWGELAERLDELAEPRIMIRDHLLDIIEGREAKQIAIDPKAERLAQLRGELEAAERVSAKYPELAESSTRKAASIAEEIAQMERD